MGSDDDIIIRNGSPKEWAEYALLRYDMDFKLFKVRAVWPVSAALLLVAWIF